MPIKLRIKMIKRWNSHDDLLKALKKDISAMMDMTSQLNRMHPGTVIDYEWSDKLKVIEGASRMVTQDTKQAIAKAESEVNCESY